MHTELALSCHLKTEINPLQIADFGMTYKLLFGIVIFLLRIAYRIWYLILSTELMNSEI